MKRDHALGARIKAAMKAAGFKTAKEFCEQYDIPYLTFAQHTQGRRHPTSDFLKLYSEAFGVTAHWIETGEGSPLSKANQKKTKEILKLSEKEIDKRLKINELLQTALDTSLLSKILQQLFSKKFQLKSKDAEKLAKAAAYIYSDISSMDEDQSTKEKLVQVAVNTFLKNIQDE
ncbi:MAG: hypothetical protein KIT27_00475 [Legionellales bacterium]|nr:hypothetical protein [Legionellales bacterium]